MTMGEPDGYRLTRGDGTFLEGRSGALLRCRADGSRPEVICGGFVDLVELVFLPGGETVGTLNWYQQPAGGLRDALVVDRKSRRGPHRAMTLTSNEQSTSLQTRTALRLNWKQLSSRQCARVLKRSQEIKSSSEASIPGALVGFGSLLVEVILRLRPHLREPLVARREGWTRCPSRRRAPCPTLTRPRWIPETDVSEDLLDHVDPARLLARALGLRGHGGGLHHLRRLLGRSPLVRRAAPLSARPPCPSVPRLQVSGCTHAAMESTGVYWKPVWHLLEGSVELVLANAAHIRNVPGRKSDVSDAVWIADLLAHGLIRASFVPPTPIQELRDLTRTRKQLTRDSALSRSPRSARGR
jgi:hypothetical protein